MIKLEEIFYKEGKFLNSERKEIKAEAVGTPVITADVNKQETKTRLINKYQNFINNKEINAYMEGSVFDYYEKLHGKLVYCIPFQFYKITKN